MSAAIKDLLVDKKPWMDIKVKSIDSDGMLVDGDAGLAGQYLRKDDSNVLEWKTPVSAEEIDSGQYNTTSGSYVVVKTTQFNLEAGKYLISMSGELIKLVAGEGALKMGIGNPVTTILAEGIVPVLAGNDSKSVVSVYTHGGGTLDVAWELKSSDANTVEVVRPKCVLVRID